MPKISELSAAVSLSGSDTVVVVQSGTTKKATVSLISGSPAGSTGELQYNNAGSFGGATNVLAGSGFISVGANPSATGSLRLANTGAIYSVLVIH